MTDRFTRLGELSVHGANVQEGQIVIIYADIGLEGSEIASDRRQRRRDDERVETDQERGQRRGHQHPTLLLHQLISDSRLCGRQRHRDAARRTAGPFPTDLVSLTR
jgi:hypothetical protein